MLLMPKLFQLQIMDHPNWCEFKKERLVAYGVNVIQLHLQIYFSVCRMRKGRLPKFGFHSKKPVTTGTSKKRPFEELNSLFIKPTNSTLSGKDIKVTLKLRMLKQIMAKMS